MRSECPEWARVPPIDDGATPCSLAGAWVSSGFNAPNAPKIHLSLVASADKPSSLAKFLLLLLPKIGCFEPRRLGYIAALPATATRLLTLCRCHLVAFGRNCENIMALVCPSARHRQLPKIMLLVCIRRNCYRNSHHSWSRAIGCGNGWHADSDCRSP